MSDAQAAEIKSLEGKKQDFGDRLKQEDAYNEQLRREKTRIEREANRIEEKLRAEVAQESERHKGTKRKRPFETQLTMLFAVHFVANG